MLGYVLHAEVLVRRRVVELGCIDQAALHRRLNFATGQLYYRHAHFLQYVGGQANGAILQAFHLARYP